MKIFPDEEILGQTEGWYLLFSKKDPDPGPYAVHNCYPEEGEFLGGGYQSTKDPTCDTCDEVCPEKIVTMERLFNL